MIISEEVLRMAIDAHEGQKDLDGKPVILHPLTLGWQARWLYNNYDNRTSKELF